MSVITIISVPEPGCNESTVDQIINGRADKKSGGAIFSFHCEEGSVLEGSSLVFCDGTKWNDTAPLCFSQFLVIQLF